LVVGCGSTESNSPQACSKDCTNEESPTSMAGAGVGGSAEAGAGAECLPQDPSRFTTADWPMPGSTDEEPKLRYSVDGDVTHDEVTGLDWQRRLPTAALVDDAAAQYCAGLRLGGHCGWRLPTRVEAVSLLDLGRPSPAFDPDGFPEADGDLVVWSGNPTRPLRLGSDGGVQVRSPTSTGPSRVRCVHSRVAPDGGQHYEVTPDVVRDLATGLTWTRATSELAYADAAAYCASVAVDGGHFRVPNVKELQTLLDETQAEPPWIDASAFSLPEPVLGHIHFWTSSREAAHADSAWLLDFNTGSVEATGATATFTLESALHVRCVRRN
jgi:hypothetical protein